MRKRPNLKVQDINAQTAVQAKDRVRVLKMEATKDEPAATQAPAGTPEKGA
jgi:hypothetical protein